MSYRVDYTVRIDGLEHETCHYCADLAEVNELLIRIEEWKAWGISIHNLADVGIKAPRVNPVIGADDRWKTHPHLGEKR